MATKKNTAEPADKPEVKSMKRTTGKVIVGCKLPNGLIINHMGKKVVLNGTNSAKVIGGHGLTEGVDKEWFLDWLKKFEDFAPVKKGLIFAHELFDYVSGEAEDKKDEKNGMEPINPDDKGDARAAGVEKMEEE